MQKKYYTKPGLFYESFSVLEVIAACDLPLKNQDEWNVCNGEDPEEPGQLYFLEGQKDCANYDMGNPGTLIGMARLS